MSSDTDLILTQHHHWILSSSHKNIPSTNQIQHTNHKYHLKRKTPSFRKHDFGAPHTMRKPPLPTLCADFDIQVSFSEMIHTRSLLRGHTVEQTSLVASLIQCRYLWCANYHQSNSRGYTNNARG